MKKVFTIKTKDESVFGELEYNVFSRNIKEAIIKIQKALPRKHYIIRAEFLCNVDEDEDLEEYIKEQELDAKEILREQEVKKC